MSVCCAVRERGHLGREDLRRVLREHTVEDKLLVARPPTRGDGAADSMRDPAGRQRPLGQSVAPPARPAAAGRQLAWQ